MQKAKQREYARRYRKNHPEYRADPKTAARAMRAWRNGMTVAEMDIFFTAHEYRCDICHKVWDGTKRGGGMTIDHDHLCCGSQAPRIAVKDRPARLCGKCNRGLLCVACNAALGQFSDDPERFTRAIKYLAGNLLLAAK